MEADEPSCQCLGPLFDYLEETNIIAHTFGPTIYLLDAPGNNLSMEKVRAYHKHGCISIGYSLATTRLQCNNVQLYDYDVKVAMEEKEELDENGDPTGQRITPIPPYAKTNLCKELQCIRKNGELIFQMAVMTGRGLDTGASCIVISYNHQTQTD